MGLGIYGLQHRFFRPTMQRYCTRKPKSILFTTIYKLFTIRSYTTYLLDKNQELFV